MENIIIMDIGEWGVGWLIDQVPASACKLISKGVFEHGVSVWSGSIHLVADDDSVVWIVG
jgi:hypothetical protein